jgi:hypothetical protein
VGEKGLEAAAGVAVALWWLGGSRKAVEGGVVDGWVEASAKGVAGVGAVAGAGLALPGCLATLAALPAAARCALRFAMRSSLIWEAERALVGGGGERGLIAAASLLCDG